ncbi:hypothetical protein L9Z73_21830, partial [Pseudomonas sp. TNT11]|nr:hypothetical protein [Pseudomonas emilianonis]
MLAIFFYALVFGFVFCLSPGAVLAETLRRGLLHGFTPALLVQVGSLVGDAVWKVLLFVYAMSGALAGLGAVMSASRLFAANGLQLG